MPVFGKGDAIMVDEDSDEEYWEFQRKLKKKKGDSEKEAKSEDEKALCKSSSIACFACGSCCECRAPGHCFNLRCHPSQKVEKKKEKKEEPAFQFGCASVMSTPGSWVG